ncbi:RHS repeat domain-containing protein [Anaerostipes hadrus]|jgi:RHS repeat-associated protein|uniref:tRNA nuclease WapA n=2 Tax=Anaerostipes hadrus TaxID=649756 RepID=A0A6N2TUV0_ANAHA|nr:RHS repeat-associated core domain-containing protein [Anaerostipes hadrus]
MGNLSSLRPCEVTTKYTYDDRGNKISEVYANGAKKTYEYNNRNLVVKTQSYDKEGTKTLISRYRYDDYGQLLEMTDYRVSSETETAYRYTEYTYDQRGRITAFAEISQNAQPTADDIKAHQIRYTYNENGNLSKVSYPTTKDGIQSLSYIYDENGWLQEIKGELHSKGQTTEKVLRSYSYDAYGKVKEIKDYRNRLKNGAQAVQKIYTYDSFDRVKEMIYTDLETGKVMESYQYSYDKNSNITKKTQVNNYPKEDADKVNETKSYTYDTLGRLTKTVTTDHNKDDKTKTVTYTYDNVGNRLKEDDGTTTTSYTYNGLDQLKTSTKEKRTAVDEVRQYSYDANGNQTDVKNTKTGQTESYTYDAENRLSKVAVTDKDGKTAVIQQNRYNGEGQRIQKVEGSKTTNYYYQDGVVSYTTDGENSQTSQNLIGTDGNILATQRYGSDHTDYLLYNKDIQGSSTSLVKENGSADATYQYTDFGETTINGDNKVENEVCYTGGIYDQSTGLYYLNARYYNPEDGRFVTEDTYRGETNEPDTQNLYVYCADNPVNYVDPSGHWIDTVLDVASLGYSIKEFMSNPSWSKFGYLLWDVGATFIPFVPGSYSRKGAKITLKIADKVHELNKGKKGLTIGKYKSLCKTIKKRKKLKIEIHHIIEKRFGKLKLKGNDYPAIPISKDLHRVITNRWRKEIPYGTDYKKLNKKTLIKAANQVYKDMPELRKVAIKIIEKYYSK